MDFMDLALEEAKKAYREGEVPVGAVIVKDDQVIARAHNEVEQRKSPLAHGEVLAIQRASEFLSSWRLDGCQMYISLEPCPMCAGALVYARIDKVYIGARDPKRGCAGSLYNLLDQEAFNHRVEVELVEREACGKILKDFFSQLRKRNKRQKLLRNSNKLV